MNSTRQTELETMCARRYELETRYEILEASEANARRALAKAKTRTLEAQQAETIVRQRLDQVLAAIDSNEAQRAEIARRMHARTQALAAQPIPKRVVQVLAPRLSAPRVDSALNRQREFAGI